MRRHINGDVKDSDFVGNNAAFTCPICTKVFIVSGFLHEGQRKCPVCKKAIGYVRGSSNNGEAFLEYDR